MKPPINIYNYVEEYHRHNDKLNREFEINEINLGVIKSFITPNLNDPELYSTYTIDEVTADKINKHLSKKISFDFDTYEYCFQRYGDYDE
ncbi:DUF7683 domain-containing protein [Flavobacterium sp. C4GT6]|uniref:DUF7683 domain-containing protein n=1 Tax=Flavobacterium sp. C4GT6 TaxID=3103818 RepID=UPI002ED67077